MTKSAWHIGRFFRFTWVLHDDLQQRLFALKAQLSLLNSINWKDQLSPGIYFDLDEIQASLSDAIDVTRNLSIDLSPVILQGQGLAESMTWLSSRMFDQHGLQVDLELRGDFNYLDNHMRILLFQSVSELLLNVVKHTGTLKAKVTLERDDQHAFITIRDGGKGFDVTKVISDPKTAHGLLIVQDRLSLMGCSMEVNSEPGKGTQVVIGAPIEAFSS